MNGWKGHQVIGIRDHRMLSQEAGREHLLLPTRHSSTLVKAKGAVPVAITKTSGHLPRKQFASSRWTEMDYWRCRDMVPKGQRLEIAFICGPTSQRPQITGWWEEPPRTVDIVSMDLWWRPPRSDQADICAHWWLMTGQRRRIRPSVHRHSLFSSAGEGVSGILQLIWFSNGLAGATGCSTVKMSSQVSVPKWTRMARLRPSVYLDACFLQFASGVPGGFVIQGPKSTW